MEDPHSPELNPGLKANEIVSPDNLHTEPVPKFVDNDLPLAEEPAPKKKK